MADSSVALPEGFELEGAPPSGTDFKIPAVGTPAGAAWKIPPEVQQERDRVRLSMLNKELASEKDPRVQTALNKEIAQTEKKVGPSKKPAAAPTIPEGFEIDKAEQQKGFIQEFGDAISGIDMKNNVFARLTSISNERSEISDKINKSDAYRAEQKRRELAGERSSDYAMIDWVKERVDKEYSKRHQKPDEKDESIGQMLHQTAQAALNHPGMVAGELVKAAVEDPELFLIPMNWELGLARVASRAGAAVKAAARTAEVGALGGAMQAPISAVQQYQETGKVSGEKVAKEAVVAGASMAALHAGAKLGLEAIAKDKGTKVKAENVEQAIDSVKEQAKTQGITESDALKSLLKNMDLPPAEAEAIGEAVKPHTDPKPKAVEPPAESPVASAVVRMGGKEYEAPNHVLALKQAMAEGMVPKDAQGRVKLNPGDTANLFKLKDGRIVTRDEVGEMMGGAKRTEDIAVKVKDLREAAQEQKMKTEPLLTRTPLPTDFQRGRIDPRLLAGMGLVGTGAAVGYLFDKDPVQAVEGALAAGGVIAAGKVLGKMVGGMGKLYDHYLADTRYRIDNLTEPYAGNVASGELAAYRVSEGVKALVKDKKLREEMTHAMQSGDLTKLSPEARSAAQELQKAYEEIGKRGQAAGILPDELLENYVTQLWVPGLNSKESLLTNLRQAMKARPDLAPGMAPRSRFGMQRSIPDYKSGMDRGLVPVTLDAAEIFRIYANNVNKAIQNKKLINALEKDRTPWGERVMVKDAPDAIQREIFKRQAIAADQIGLDPAAKQMIQETSVIRAPREYKTINHPQLRGYKVHQDVVAPLKALFDAADANAATRAAYAVSVAAKRGLFSFSLFHAKSLLDAFLGTPLAGWKKLPGVMGQIKGGAMGDAVDQLVKAGLKIVEKPIEADVGPLSNAMKLIESKFPVAGFPVKGVRWVQEHLDHLLWNVIHPSFKTASALALYEKGIRKQPNVPKEQVAKQVSSAVNDIFGGLDWYRMADGVQNKYGRDLALALTSPSGRRFMQIAMLAPDWTVATTRAMAKAIPGVSEKAIGDIHRGYVLRSALLYLMVGNALNNHFSGHNLWENEDPTMVDLGDGRRLQLSKHFMEPVHWLTKPGQQAINKLGYVIKEPLEQAFEKQYLSTKGAPPMDTSVVGRVKHAVGSASPIPLQNLMTDPGAAAAGVVGLPIYGKTEDQAAALAVEKALKLDKDAARAEKRVRSQYAKKRKKQQEREEE